MTAKPKDSYQPGDLIFVKLKGYPHWPARIEGEPVTQLRKNFKRTINKNSRRCLTSYTRKWPVFFYGSHEHALLFESTIFPYDKHKDEFHKERSNATFNLGLWELLHNPGAVHQPSPTKTNKVTAAAKPDKNDDDDFKVADKKEKTLFTKAEKPKVFLPGELIFAKLRGWPHWPARIEGEPVARIFSSKVKKIQACHSRIWPVFFFGSHDKAFIGEKGIFPYDKHKEEFHKERSNYPAFNLGLWELLNNPGALHQPSPTKTKKLTADAESVHPAGGVAQVDVGEDGEVPRTCFKQVLKETKTMSKPKQNKQKITFHVKERMKKAKDAVEQGMHYTRASKSYNVPLKTLKRKTFSARLASGRTAKRKCQNLQMQETLKLRKDTIKSLPTKPQDGASTNPDNHSTENTKQDNITTLKANLKMFLQTLCKAFLSFESEVELKCNIHLNIDKSKTLEFDLNETIATQKNANVSNSRQSPQNKCVKPSKNPKKPTYPQKKLITDNSQNIKAKKMKQKKGSNKLNVKTNQPHKKKQKKSVPSIQAQTMNNTEKCPSIQPSTSFLQSKNSTHSSYVPQTHPEYMSFSHSANSETYRSVSYSLPTSVQTDDKIYSACEVVIEKCEPDVIMDYEPAADIGACFLQEPYTTITATTEENQLLQKRTMQDPYTTVTATTEENQQAVFKIEVNIDHDDYQPEGDHCSSACDLEPS